MNASLVVIGVENVGKLYWFKVCKNPNDIEFPHKHSEFGYKGVRFEYVGVNVGQFPAMDDLIIKRIGEKENVVVVLMFSITNRQSFDALAVRLEEIMQNTTFIIVVGSKCDLENERQVLTEEGEEFANAIGAKYFEISSKEQIGYSQPLDEAVSILKNQNRNEKRKRDIIKKIFTGK